MQDNWERGMNRFYLLRVILELPEPRLDTNYFSIRKINMENIFRVNLTIPFSPLQKNPCLNILMQGYQEPFLFSHGSLG